MSYFNVASKTYRLDINISLVEQLAEPGETRIEIVPQIFLPTDRVRDAFRCVLRFAIHVPEKNTGREILGYLYEFGADFTVTHENEDYPFVLQFVETAILNMEQNFVDNSPIQFFEGNILKVFDENVTARNVFEQLKSAGYYQ